LNPRPALYEGEHAKADFTDHRKKGSIVDATTPEIALVESANAQRMPNGEPSDGELERGILDAVKLGLLDVARTLSGRLDARQRERASNVVALDTRRRSQ
jgi:hypothetical protein